MSLTEDLASYGKGISEDTEHGASHILKVASGSLHTALIKNPQTNPTNIREAVKDFAVSLVFSHRQMACVLNFSMNFFSYSTLSKMIQTCTRF